MHLHLYAVLATALVVSYLALVLPNALTHLRPTHPPSASSAQQQKLATLLKTYALTWALLLAATVATGRLGLGSVHYVTV